MQSLVDISLLHITQNQGACQFQSYMYRMMSCNNFTNLPPREAWKARLDFQKYITHDSEEWKTIPGFPDYKISSSSIVMNEQSYGSRRRIIVQTIRNNKYFYVTLTAPDGRRVGFPVDLLMIIAFFDVPKEKVRQVIHNDFIKHNNQLNNLSYILW